MKSIHILLLTALAVPATAASQSPEDGARAALENWETALNGGNAAALAEHYTDDAIVVAPTQEIIGEKGAIGAFWAEKRATGTRDFTVDVINARSDGDRLYQTAVWSATVDRDGRESRFDGEMTTVMVRQPGGDWKIQVQNWY